MIDTGWVHSHTSTGLWVSDKLYSTPNSSYQSTYLFLPKSNTSKWLCSKGLLLLLICQSPWMIMPCISEYWLSLPTSPRYFCFFPTIRDSLGREWYFLHNSEYQLRPGSCKCIPQLANQSTSSSSDIHFPWWFLQWYWFLISRHSLSLLYSSYIRPFWTWWGDWRMISLATRNLRLPLRIGLIHWSLHHISPKPPSPSSG